ncbi:cell division transport system permease protein [Paucidesulfovibrio gracilis DSM 16080]|uniref:Cell division protein FtsX n=1 Tax=Paucidesulfovibrio gracilis DSM 16080 TaxID=1121449 RepID=A0A1T4XPG4_9BACT|nr:FtsX-like permease family protein [Paucidesulfovibrio gracilis]SKA91450.1 cell division transport system permease protein [Paucidesulfovibrio gracilis DSM 16080]
MILRLLRLIGRGVRESFLHPWAQLFTLSAVTMAAVLAGIFLLLLHNVNQELIRNRGAVEFQIFWRHNADMDVVRGQWERMASMDHLKELETFTPERALRELSRDLSGQSALDWLEEENPLPPSAFLAFNIPPGDHSEVWAKGLLAELRVLPEVQAVHYNPMQLDLAKSWLAVSHSVIWPVVGFLALVVALVVGNTVKLSMLTRKDEIEILSLVGARPWYIRAPLLASGAFTGLVSSGLALGLLRLLHLRLEHVLDFPPVFLVISFFPTQHCLLLAGVVTLVCVAGSWVAVRH